MLDTKRHAYQLLINDATLVTALGSSAKIQYQYPNDFNTLPIVTYFESGTRQLDFYDDMPATDESTITIDVWANVSTTAISKIIDDIMARNLYTRDFGTDVPDPDVKIFHKSLRYRRTFSADDLDAL